MSLFLFLLAQLIELKIHIKNQLKIMEAQIGSILKETDIVRYQDIYGRVK